MSELQLATVPNHDSRRCVSMPRALSQKSRSRGLWFSVVVLSPSISSISTTATSPARSSSPCARSSTSTTARSASSAAPSSGSTHCRRAPRAHRGFCPAAKSSWHGESSYGPAMTASAGLAHHLRDHCLLSRVGVGVGEAACAPTATSWLGDLFPQARRSRVLALFHARRAGRRRTRFFLQRPDSTGVWLASRNGICRRCRRCCWFPL